MSEFITVNPRMSAEETAALFDKYRQEGKKVVGLEMTVRGQKELCDKNVDPQHTDKKVDESCAKCIATKADETLGEFRGQDVVFVTNRYDLDAAAAFVLADRYIKGEEIGYNANIGAINAHDTFSNAKNKGGEWPGARPIEQVFDPENKTAALAGSLMSLRNTVTPESLDNVAQFVDTGKVNDSMMDRFRATQKRIIADVNSGVVDCKVVNGIAVVKTNQFCATDVGYSKAPVIIAYNDKFEPTPGNVVAKFTVAQYNPKYVNMEALTKELNEIQPGHGGSATIVGSPQGVNAEVGLDKLVKLATKHLTPEYKKSLGLDGLSKTNSVTGR